MKIFRDKLILGAVAGLIADIIQNIAQWPLLKLGILKYDLDVLAGSLFIWAKGDLLLMSPLGQFIGFLSGLALSIILGITFVYIIQASGFQYVKCKGILYGFVLWFLIYGGARAALHLSPIRDDNPRHTIVQLVIHLLFGYIVGLLISKQGGVIMKDES